MTQFDAAREVYLVNEKASRNECIDAIAKMLHENFGVPMSAGFWERLRVSFFGGIYNTAPNQANTYYTLMKKRYP